MGLLRSNIIQWSNSRTPFPHNRALSIAGLPPLTLHGLRRTFASLAEWVEMPHGIVAQIMRHAPSATAERHYINRPLELLAVWHGKYEAWILQEAGISFVSTQAVLRKRLLHPSRIIFDLML